MLPAPPFLLPTPPKKIWANINTPASPKQIPPPHNITVDPNNTATTTHHHLCRPLCEKKHKVKRGSSFVACFPFRLLFASFFAQGSTIMLVGYCGVCVWVENGIGWRWNLLRIGRGICVYSGLSGGAGSNFPIQPIIHYIQYWVQKTHGLTQQLELRWPIMHIEPPV